MNVLDLENSYIYFNCNSDNCWRASIQSTLVDLTDNKTYYLTKECRAELVGQYPFQHPAKSELCVVVENNNKKFLIRNNPVLKKHDFDDHHYDSRSLIENLDEIILTKKDYELLNYDIDLSFSNLYLDTPVHYILIKNTLSPKLIEKILEKTEDYNIQNIDGDTIVHLLFRKHNWKKYKNILNIKNMNVFLTNKRGEAPIDYIKKKDLKKISISILANSKKSKECIEKIFKKKSDS